MKQFCIIGYKKNALSEDYDQGWSESFSKLTYSDVAAHKYLDLSQYESLWMQRKHVKLDQLQFVLILQYCLVKNMVCTNIFFSRRD